MPPDAPSSPPPTPRCPGIPDRGLACTYRLKPDETHCYNHDPARAEERRANARKARLKPGDLGSELGTYDGLARRAAKVLEELDVGFMAYDAKGHLHFEPSLAPALAIARLNALRFLAAMVARRTATPASRAIPVEEGEAFGSVEGLVG